MIGSFSFPFFFFFFVVVTGRFLYSLEESACSDEDPDEGMYAWLLSQVLIVIAFIRTLNEYLYLRTKVALAASCFFKGTFLQ